MVTVFCMMFHQTQSDTTVKECLGWFSIGSISNAVATDREQIVYWMILTGTYNALGDVASGIESFDYVVRQRECLQMILPKRALWKMLPVTESVIE